MILKVLFTSNSFPDENLDVNTHFEDGIWCGEILSENMNIFSQGDTEIECVKNLKKGYKTFINHNISSEFFESNINFIKELDSNVYIPNKDKVHYKDGITFVHIANVDEEKIASNNALSIDYSYPNSKLDTRIIIGHIRFRNMYFLKHFNSVVSKYICEKFNYFEDAVSQEEVDKYRHIALVRATLKYPELAKIYTENNK